MKARVILAGLSIAVLVSCGGDNDGSVPCGDTSAKQERVVSNFSSTLMIYNKPIDPVVQEIPSPLALNQSPTWNRFSISLQATYQTYSVQLKPRIEFSLFEQANACSLVPPAAKQRLTKISITSANDFSASYPASSELLNVFAWVNNDSLSLTSLLLNQPAPLKLELKLREPPQFARQNFTIQITLDDGGTYLLNTGDIYFTL